MTVRRSLGEHGQLNLAKIAPAVDHDDSHNARGEGLLKQITGRAARTHVKQINICHAGTWSHREALAGSDVRW